jgi:hypothetical protein
MPDHADAAYTQAAVQANDIFRTVSSVAPAPDGFDPDKQRAILKKKAGAFNTWLARKRDEIAARALEPQPAERSRPPVGKFTLLDLGADTCRFPIGDGPYLFCGAPPVAGLPYCAGCARVLYARTA